MKKTNKKGFTIVELVIVIAVIGILAAILIPTFVNLTENARAAALQSNLRNAYTAYLADAEDGENDEFGGALVERGMDKVVMSTVAENPTASNSYVWKALTPGAEEKWNEGVLTGGTLTLVGSAKGTYTSAQNSLYNTYYVYYVVVA